MLETQSALGRPWRPLLRDDAAVEALATAEAIAADVVARGGRAIRPDPLGTISSLATGDAGLALFLAYLDQARPGRGWDARAARALERAAAHVAAERTLPNLYDGFTGVAWTLEHLAGRLFKRDEDDANATVDEALLAHVSRPDRRREVDLTSGLAGFGLYALARLPRPSARTLLEQVVTRLEQMAEADGAGLTWRTPPERLAPDVARRFPRGQMNLGVAHGVPGVIAILARAGAAGVAPGRVASLVDSAVAWLLDQRLDEADEGAGSVFPFAVGPGVRPRVSRTAWCYGDPGIAAALLLAARALGRRDWESAALDLARSVARRAFERAGVEDAALCHGSAGVAHLLLRLHHATGDVELGDAARAWFLRTLAARRPGEGLGGYLSWTPGPDGEHAWSADPSFMAGAAGIGLALVAAATPHEPSWDELLLASPCAPGGA